MSVNSIRTISATIFHIPKAGWGTTDVGHVELYFLMDVMVCPRRSVRITQLATPLKPLEAMALAKAILASGVGGLRELIESDATGALFEPENLRTFCRKAGQLLLDEKLRRTLGENARRTVCVEKDWKSSDALLRIRL